ncbi:hypothetical protein ACFLU1_00630 [Chloroflexota bacterium]
MSPTLSAVTKSYNINKSRFEDLTEMRMRAILHFKIAQEGKIDGKENCLGGK